MRYNLSTLLVVNVMIALLLWLNVSTSQSVLLVSPIGGASDGIFLQPIEVSHSGWPLNLEYNIIKLPPIVSENEAHRLLRSRRYQLPNGRELQTTGELLENEMIPFGPTKPEYFNVVFAIIDLAVALAIVLFVGRRFQKFLDTQRKGTQP